MVKDLSPLVVRNFLCRALTLLFLFTLPAPSPSQEIRFDHFSIEDGLSQDIVTSIIQDHRGFMWFGTEDGLNRYDGYNFYVYKNDPRDSSSISDNWIRTLYVDHEGRIWIGTSAGVDLYDPRRDQFIRFNHGSRPSSVPAGNWITSICEDNSGNIWVVSGNGFHKVEFAKRLLRRTSELTPVSDVGPTVTNLFPGRNGTLWVSTRTHLYKMEQGDIGNIAENLARRSPFAAVSGLENDLVEDWKGDVWIATADSGVIRLDATGRTRICYRHREDSPRTLGTDVVLSLCLDSRGRVWIGTFGSLDMYDPEVDGFVHYVADPANPSSLSGSRIYRLYTDRAGALWVGTYQGGISRFDPLKQRFIYYRHHPRITGSLSGDEVRCLTVDRNGHLWVGTSAGVDRLDRNTRQFRHIVDARTQFGGWPVTALRTRPDGSLWVGTEPGTLFLVDSTGRILRTLLNMKDEKSVLGHRAIVALYETDDGHLWIGTSQAGLMNLETRTWKLDIEPLAATGASFGLGVWVIFEDRKGILWFGGWAGSSHFVRFDPRTKLARQYEGTPTSQASDRILNARTVYEDPDGILWIGTWGGGLRRYDQASETVSSITERDGLSNNFVKGILGDARGRLWISTERGLTRYDPNSGSFKRFTRGDGLQGDRFLSGSCCLGGDGWMYFGGENGFNAFHPDSVSENSYIPPVVITRLRILDRTVIPKDSINNVPFVRLDYSDDYLAFDFVALNYTQVQHNQYAYMMEGFDRTWIQAGSRRFAAYTHLDGGTYTFRVKASNNDGVWNEAGTSMVIIINPPFWKTWWFFTLIAIVSVVALYAVYRYRVHRVLEIERLRARIASDLHDELASNLTSIAMFGKIISDNAEVRRALPDQFSLLLDRITTMSTESISSIRDIIWAIDPRAETLGGLLERLSDSVGPECRARNIRLAFVQTPEHSLPTTNLTPEQRKHLWLILKEAVHNALKHSGCSSIVVGSEYANGSLSLTVIDDGKGIPAQEQAGGRGLDTMRQRARELRGEFSVNSAASHGTSVKLTLKF